VLVGIHLLGAASVVFTVQNEQEYKEFLAAGTSPIFDGFLPEA
jgi:hypothetical protein